MLALDEMVDEGIILEADPSVLVNRVALRYSLNAETVMSPSNWNLFTLTLSLCLSFTHLIQPWFLFLYRTDDIPLGEQTVAQVKKIVIDENVSKGHGDMGPCPRTKTFAWQFWNLEYQGKKLSSSFLPVYAFSIFMVKLLFKI